MGVEATQIYVEAQMVDKGLNAGLKETSTNSKKAKKDIDLLNAAMGKLSDSMEVLGGDFKTSLNKLTSGFTAFGDKLDKLTGKIDRYAKSIKNISKESTTLNKVQKQAAGMADKMFGNTSRGAAQANRFNSANFLAQFQDIAVTSAMGMNPMLIAMQQGTQLQYILAQSNAPLKDFVAGLKSAFSTVGLLTVGLTGLTAALIQTVNWSSVGKSVLNGLSDVFGFIADNATAFTIAVTAATTTLILFNSSAILGVIVNLGKLGMSALAAGAKMAYAWVIAMGPVGWVLSTIALLTTAWLAFPEGVEKVFKAVGKFIKDTLNQWIGYILSFGYQVSGVFDILANAPFMGWDEAVRKYEEEVKKIRSVDYIASLGEGLEILDDATGNVASSAGKGLVNSFEKVNKSISDTFKTWSEGLGKTEDKIKKTKTEVDKLAEAWDKLNLSAQNKIDDLVTQRSLIGAGSYEKTYVQTLNDAMRQAQGAGIDLYSTTANGQTVIQVLNENAQATAALTEENERLNASYEFSKSTVKGFFSEMRVGLRDGQSAWEAFGNAVNSVLDKILDKIMDIGVDALFGAGRNYFGTSAMGFGGMFGGLTSGTASTGIGGLQVGQSAGNLTYLGSVAAAANGGVFSNGVYSSPTLFKFGKGGKFGVMGEAGPEAVMPLTRGPDGSLGVRADGGSSSPVVVNVINNSNAQAKVEQRQTSQGMEIDVMIDQLVAEKMNQPGTSSNSALRAFSNQKLIAR